MNSNTLLTADKFVINNEKIKSIYKSNGKSYNPYNVWPLVGGMGMRKRHFTSFRVTYLVNRYAGYFYERFKDGAKWVMIQMVPMVGPSKWFVYR